LFEKFGADQPLNGQWERYAREGVELSLTTLADQGSARTAALMALYRLIEAHTLAAERLHGDDTTIPVLAGGKTDTAPLWTYVRDDRPFGAERCQQRSTATHVTDPLTCRAALASPRQRPMPATTACSGRADNPSR
jgi:hypothetical protein